MAQQSPTITSSTSQREPAESGVAVADLPDPAELASAAPVDAAVNADDLIAKMAEQEIEQMLDKADVSTDASAGPAHLATSAADLDRSIGLETQPDDALEAARAALEDARRVLDADLADKAPIAPTPGADAKPDASSEATATATTDPAPTPAAPTAGAADADHVEAPKFGPPPSATIATDASKSKSSDNPNASSADAVARELEQDAQVTAHTPIEPGEPHAGASVSTTPAAPSLTDQALAALPQQAGPASLAGRLTHHAAKVSSWPLEAMPDSAAEAIGVAAIVTLVNALAILAYVMLMR